MGADGGPNNPSAFVCGPISHALTDEGFDSAVKELLVAVAANLNDHGVRVLSAHRAEHWGELIPQRAAEVLRRDWSLAQAADAMVIVLPANPQGELYRTDGTFIELGWALALDKPLIVVTDLGAEGRSYMFDGVLEAISPDAIVSVRDDRTLAEVAGRVRTLVSARNGRGSVRSTGEQLRIGFCTTTFGFGPVSKVSAIAEALRALRPLAELTFVGSDIALTYAQATGAFDEIIEIDSDKEPERAVDALSRVDAVVNSLNFAMLAAGAERPQYFVDSLGWLWPDTPAEAACARIYFVQDYLFTPERRSALPANARLVPPIVSPVFRSRRCSWEGETGHALVHLGGCRNPLLPGDAYAEYVKNMVDGFVLALADDRIDGRIRSATVCGNPELLSRIRASRDPRVTISFLPRQAFAGELRRAEMLLTSPGLTSTLEALSLGVPCSFLLPHNFSQYRIDEAYRNAGLHRAVWPDPLSVPGLSFSEVPEEEGVQLVAESLSQRLSEGPERSAQAFVNLLAEPDGRLMPGNAPGQPLAWDGSTRVAEAVVDWIEQEMVANGSARGVHRS
jgi:nucleoside 2-deoxyribosyltransferase